jgi:hypothetical protein
MDSLMPDCEPNIAFWHEIGSGDLFVAAKY